MSRPGRFMNQPWSMPNERWRCIANFEDYEVSDLGRIRSSKRISKRILSPSKSGNIILRQDTENHYFKIAQLILRTFRGPPKNGDWLARHLDDDTTNNKLANLAWGTQKTNYDDAVRNGTHGPGSPGAILRGQLLKDRPRSRIVKEKISQTKRRFPKRQYHNNAHGPDGRFIGANK